MLRFATHTLFFAQLLTNTQDEIIHNYTVNKQDVNSNHIERM